MLRARPIPFGRPEASALVRRATAALAVLLTASTLTASAATVGATDRKAKAIAAEKPPILSLNDALIHDAASPMLGNPQGDVTIVAFVDYNCAYCKKSEADLEALLADDPKVRVIYKDWPILAKTSVAAAKVAIAATWQGKYAEMHKALMRMKAHPANDADISEAAVAAGVDVTRLNKDLDQRDGEIIALLKRNFQEADALQLKGTPVYLIGPFITASPLDLPQFKQIVADARADQAKPRRAGCGEALGPLFVVPGRAGEPGTHRPRRLRASSGCRNGFRVLAFGSPRNNKMLDPAAAHAAVRRLHRRAMVLAIAVEAAAVVVIEEVEAVAAAAHRVTRAADAAALRHRLQQRRTCHRRRLRQGQRRARRRERERGGEEAFGEGRGVHGFAPKDHERRIGEPAPPLNDLSRSALRPPHGAWAAPRRHSPRPSPARSRPA